MNEIKQDDMPSQLTVDLLLVRKYGILAALIAADLRFWLITLKKENRWTRYERWVDIFNVSYSTIKREKKVLENMFEISRTKLKLGGVTVLGANNFKLKAPRSLENEPNKFSSIIFPIEYIRLAKKLAPTGKTPEFAWFLYRVSWLMYQSKIERPNRTVTTFKSMNWLSSHCNMTTRTLERYAEHCRKIGCLIIMGRGITTSEEWDDELLLPLMRIAKQLENGLTKLIDNQDVSEVKQCWAIDTLEAVSNSR